MPRVIDYQYPNYQVEHSMVMFSIYSPGPAFKILYGDIHNLTICKSAIINELILVGDRHYDATSTLNGYVQYFTEYVFAYIHTGYTPTYSGRKVILHIS